MFEFFFGLILGLIVFGIATIFVVVGIAALIGVGTACVVWFGDDMDLW